MNEADPSEPRHRSLGSLAVRGASLSGLGYALAQALNLVAYVVLARLLDPSEFGVFAAATALLGFALLITESGMTSALVQWRGNLEVAANTALLSSIGSGFLFGLLALATAPILGWFFDSGEVAAVAAAMAGMVTLRILTVVPDAMMQRRFAFVRRLVIEPAQVTVFGVASIVAALNDLGAWSLVIGQYAGTLTDVLLSWGLARWRPRPRLASYPVWRELVGFGRHVLTATTILRAGEQADSLIVGGIIGTSGLGQFRYAFRVTSSPFLALLAAAAYVLYPAFARIADEKERFEAAFLRSLQWMAILAMPASMILIPLGIPITVIVFGEQWRPAGNATTAMFAYTAGLMISSIVSEALKARGRPDRLTPLHAVTAGVTAGSMLALASFGLVEAAAAVSLGAIAAAIYALRLGVNILGIPLGRMLTRLRPPFIAAAMMAAILTPIELALDADARDFPLSLILLLAEGLLGLCIYVATLRLQDRTLLAEAREMVGMLRSRPKQERVPDEIPEADMDG